MSIEPTIKLPVDTVATITSSGLFGDKYLSLEPGNEDDVIKPGGQIDHTQSPMSLESLIGQYIFNQQPARRRMAARRPRRNNARVTARGQRWDPERYRRNAAFVARARRAGAGAAGARSRASAFSISAAAKARSRRRSPARADVLGIDASAEQVAASRARGLEAAVMDGARLAFDAGIRRRLQQRGAALDQGCGRGRSTACGAP